MDDSSGVIRVTVSRNCTRFQVSALVRTSDRLLACSDLPAGKVKNKVVPVLKQLSVTP
jgi:hypothetical protein